MGWTGNAGRCGLLAALCGALAACGPGDPGESSTGSTTAATGDASTTGIPTTGTASSASSSAATGFDCDSCPAGYKCDDTNSSCVIDCQTDRECPAGQCCVSGFNTCAPCGDEPIPCTSSATCPADAPHCIYDKEWGTSACRSWCYRASPFLACVDHGSCCGSELCGSQTEMCWPVDCPDGCCEQGGCTGGDTGTGTGTGG